jgi:hypothetical protein
MDDDEGQQWWTSMTTWTRMTTNDFDNDWDKENDRDV